MGHLRRSGKNKSSAPPMLRRLKRQFVLITGAMVAVVLGVALGVSYASTYNTQLRLTDQMLERGTSDDTFASTVLEVNGITSLRERDGAGDEPGFASDAGVVKVLVSGAGTIVDQSDSASITYGVQAIQEIVSEILSDGGEEGYLPEWHVEWRMSAKEYGTAFDGYLIAFTDTTQRDLFLRAQAITSVGIFALGLVGSLAVAWALSSFALRPVEDAWERQRRFIADASHELKTPLAVIIANTEILQRDKTLGADARRWVDSTADESEHMKELIGELLELARTDEAVSAGGAGTQARQDCNLSEMVESAVLEFDAVAFERGCSIEESVEPDVHFEADRSWMDRALRVLIDNATKYAEKGSVVSVSLSREGKRIRYSVNNKGAAIDPEDLPHVFDRFYRSDKARSRSDAGGFGLGLAIAKGIVEAHGGTIGVMSDADEGTTFTVML